MIVPNRTTVPPKTAGQVMPSPVPSLHNWEYMPLNGQTNIDPTTIPNINQQLFEEKTKGSGTELRMRSQTIWGLATNPVAQIGNVVPQFSALQKRGDAILNVEGGDLILTAQTRGNATGLGGWIRLSTTTRLSVPPQSPLPVIRDYERMTITDTGWVGIGTSDPHFQLVVAARPPAVGGSNSNPGTILQLYDSSATYGGISFTSNPGVDFSIGKRSGVNTTYLQMCRQNGDMLTSLTPQGNLGIGVQDPIARLQVHGNCAIGSNDGAAPSMATLFPSGNGVWWNMASVSNGQVFAIAPGSMMNADDAEATWQGAAIAVRSVSGNVGIGTIAPDDRLHIKDGALRLSSGTAACQMVVAPGDGLYSNFATTGDLVLRSTETAGDVIISARNASGAVRFGTGATDAERMTILNNGNVGIGTINPRAKFVVNGLVCATEMRVSLSGSPCWWPDYVFDDGYRLMPLQDLGRYVTEQKHLPGVVSAREVEKDGIQLGEMQGKLLQKIEELTLYVIDQDKRVKELESQVAQLKH